MLKEFLRKKLSLNHIEKINRLLCILQKAGWIKELYGPTANRKLNANKK